MAKKEKKPKKEKPAKGAKGKKGAKVKKIKVIVEPDIPYAGSDRVKTILAVLLAILCGVCIGLSIYTLHYSRSAQSTASAEAETLAYGPIVNGAKFFSQPDGTYLRE